VGLLDPVRRAPWFEYSPIVSRPRLEWPGGARVAFWVAPNVEIYDFEPPPNPYNTAYNRVPRPPDVMSYSFLDYGNRVGFWRMLEVLDRYEIPASISLNMAVLDHLPEVAAAMIERGWELFSHGLYNSRFLYGLDRDAERAWVEENKEILRRHTGRELKGMFGPFLSQTAHSMEVWAEAGIEYVVDFFVDDQPIGVTTPGGTIVNVPYGYETNDALVMGGLWGRGGSYESDYFTQLCMNHFDTLYEEGAESGTVMCIALHPFVIGQPWRPQYLDRILDYVLGHDGVWLTSADRIAGYWRERYLDAPA